MSAKPEPEGLKYGLPEALKSPESLDFSRIEVGQRNPQHCPYLAATDSALPPTPDPLGAPLNIDQVAALLGCSAWTVRQRHIPHGLPYLRASAAGKLVFFRQQVIDWILKQQQKEQKKGGIRP